MPIEITGLTNSPNQQLKPRTESNVSFVLDLFFIPTDDTSGNWYYSIEYVNTATKRITPIQSKRLLKSGNLLLQNQNILPFGIACVSIDKYDPAFLDDFVSGRIKLYTTEFTEKDIINELIYTLQP